uniref:Uncharacterized protein n=1 Tax=Physcomitrium patens TaxID=3218 RepID=A0A2K1J9J2_PHYPA|nr:hypothetical protein PHYPA_021307 [Physcomitrium patens]
MKVCRNSWVSQRCGTYGKFLSSSTIRNRYASSDAGAYGWTMKTSSFSAITVSVCSRFQGGLSSVQENVVRSTGNSRHRRFFLEN